MRLILLALLALVFPCVANAQRDRETGPDETITILGTVLGPNERPIAGARLYVNVSERVDSIELGTSRQNGSFRFEVSRNTLMRTVTPQHSLLKCKASLMVVADGYGAAWALLPSQDGGRFGEMKSEYDVRLKLVDDLPVKGRIVDRAGHPVSGAVVTVDNVHELRGRRWHKMVPAIESLDVSSMSRTEIDVSGWMSGQYPDAWKVVSRAITDESGYINLAGLGSNRAVTLQVCGPSVRSPRKFAVLVREDATEFARLVREKYPPRGRDDGVRMYGARPTIVVERTRTVAGTVRDAVTGEPVEGVSVHVMGVGRRVRTDRDGRYRLVRADHRSTITVVANGDEELYLPATRTLTGVGGLGESCADFKIPRGVLLRGKVVEQGTDRPIASQHRQSCHDVGLGPLIAGYAAYYPLKNNRWIKTLGDGLPKIPFGSSSSNHSRRVSIDEQGEFRIAVPPGPGIVLIHARPPEPFEHRASVAKVPYMTVGGDVIGALPKAPPRNLKFPGIERPITADGFHAFKMIDPTEDDDHLDLPFEVQPPPSVVVRFADPNGKPIKGAKVAGLVPKSKRGQLRVIKVEGSDAIVYDVSVDRPRKLVAINSDGEYGISCELRLRLFDRDASPTIGSGPYKITMRPTASLKFRLLDQASGKPLVGYRFWLTYDEVGVLAVKKNEGLITDPCGHVVIPSILPDETMSLIVVPPPKTSPESRFGFKRAPEVKLPERLKGLALHTGEQRDLGVLRVELIDEE